MEIIEKKGLIQKLQGMSKRQRITFWAFVALTLYTLVGFFAAPALVKILLEKKIPEILQRSVAIEKITFNPYTLTASIENFALQQKDGSENFVSFERIFVNLQLSSLLKRALVIQALQLSEPKINFARLNEESYSFSDLLTDSTNKKDPGPPEKPSLFSINNIEIINGTIAFDDRPKDKRHLLSALNLSIPTLSNLPPLIDTNVKPAFSVQMNDTQITLAGQTKPFSRSRETTVDIHLSNLHIPEYLAYIANPTNATITSGRLDIDTQLSYSSDGSKEQRLSLSGLISLSDLNLVDLQEKSFGRFPKIDIKLAASNLLNKDVVVDSLTITKPEVDLIQQTDGTMLPISLFAQEKTTSSSNSLETEETTPLSLAIKTITLNNGTISFVDHIANDFKTTLRPFDLTLKNFNSRPQSVADFLVHFTSETNEDFTTEGQIGLDPLVVDGKIDLSALNLAKYTPYLTDILIAEITGGKLDVSSHFHVDKTENASQTNLKNMALLLTDFSLANGLENIVTLPHLTISDTEIDLDKQQITIGQFNSQAAKIHIVKDTKGEINLSQLIKNAEKEQPAAGLADEATTQLPWTVSLNNGRIDQYAVTFTDHGPSTTATTEITDIKVELSHISTAPNSQGDLDFSLTVNDDGTLSGKGSLGLSPFSTDLAVDTALALAPLQNYVADHAQIIITDGMITTRGQLKISTENEMDANFKGDTKITNLSLADDSGEDLFKWQELKISGEEFSSHPHKLTIAEVNWSDLFLQLSVLPDGSLNLSHIVTPSPATTDGEKMTSLQKDQEVPKNPIEININTFMLSGGTLKFSDLNISPAYEGAIDNLAGTITGLSTQKESLAQVELSGRVNQQAPLHITGSINPLKDDLFADLKLDFQDIDLSSTSPYTGKFIGYKTDKGKLTLNLHYTINGQEIQAENKAFLDQFTLGDSVESPDAVSLPIRLAIALLKNRSGEIFLDIPVQGNRNDPEFSVASVVFRVLFNLIAKAATSPFALLGALIPDGEDLQSVSFKPGISEITPDAAEKLTKLASVLYERPGLRMDIQGSSSAEQDRLSLAESRLTRQLQLQKIKELSRLKKGGEPLKDNTDLTPEEYRHYLELAYKEGLGEDERGTTNDTPVENKVEYSDDAARSEDSPKSPGPVDKEKPLTDTFMKTALLKKITITDEDLRLLAVQRGTNVVNFLSKTGPVEPERLFLIEPKMVADQNDGMLSAAQVDLIIK